MTARQLYMLRYLLSVSLRGAERRSNLCLSKAEKLSKIMDRDCFASPSLHSGFELTAMTENKHPGERLFRSLISILEFFSEKLKSFGRLRKLITIGYGPAQKVWVE